MATGDSASIDVALRVFGVSMLVLPLWVGSVKYFMSDMGGDGLRGENKANIAFILVLAYATILGSLVSAASYLVESGGLGEDLTISLFFAQGFAILVGAGVMEPLMKVVDGRQEKRFIWGVSRALWIIYVVLFYGVSNLSLS